MGILKRVIFTPAIYPHFLNFFTLTFRALDTHCHDLGHDSRMTVMSEIECAQLHNKRLGRRHSTLQSHGLFALAKHLFSLSLSRRPRLYDRNVSLHLIERLQNARSVLQSLSRQQH